MLAAWDLLGFARYAHSTISYRTADPKERTTGRRAAVLPQAGAAGTLVDTGGFAGAWVSSPALAVAVLNDKGDT